MIEDSFAYPEGDPRYARNALAPGAAPIEAVCKMAQPQSLSFNLEPLGPDATGSERRDMASREMRRLVGENFGREALYWFDGASESHRGMARSAALNYGTFLLTNGFRLADMQPMLDELGLGGRLASILQVIGVALGGRFDIPSGAALVAFGRGPQGVELELQVMLDAIPDLPPNFLQLLTMNLRERPRELVALERFLEAFTPEDNVWPGRFSILGIRIGPSGPPKVSLFLRPVEFEITPAAALVPNGVKPKVAVGTVSPVAS